MHAARRCGSREERVDRCTGSWRTPSAGDQDVGDEAQLLRATGLNQALDDARRGDVCEDVPEMRTLVGSCVSEVLPRKYLPLPVRRYQQIRQHPHDQLVRGLAGEPVEDASPVQVGGCACRGEDLPVEMVVLVLVGTDENPGAYEAPQGAIHGIAPEPDIRSHPRRVHGERACPGVPGVQISAHGERRGNDSPLTPSHDGFPLSCAGVPRIQSSPHELIGDRPSGGLRPVRSGTRRIQGHHAAQEGDRPRGP